MMITLLLSCCLLSTSQDALVDLAETKISFPSETVSIQEFTRLVQENGNRVAVPPWERGMILPTAGKVVSFWQAIDHVSGKVRAPFQFQSDESYLVRFLNRDDSWQPPLVAYSGPFRFAIHSVAARKDFTRPDQSVIELAVELLWEPRLRPIALVWNEESVSFRMKDEKKTKAAQGGAALIRLIGMPGHRWKVTLPLPSREEKEMASVTLQGRILIPPTQQPYTVESVTDSEHKFAETSLKLDKVTTNADITRMHLQVSTRAKDPQWESHQYWAFGDTTFRLVHKKTGKAYLAEKNPAQVTADHLIEFDPVWRKFPGPLTDYRLIVDFPTPIIIRSFSVTWKNIPLP